MHCKSFSYFFNKNYRRILDINVLNFNATLTNDVVSFEQPGPGVVLFSILPPFSVGVNSKRKEFTPIGANSFKSRPYFRMALLSRKASRKSQKLLVFKKNVEEHEVYLHNQFYQVLCYCFYTVRNSCLFLFYPFSKIAIHCITEKYFLYLTYTLGS